MAQAAVTGKNDFSKGAVWKNIMSLSVPLMVAQLVQLCYNIVDRIYIGHLPGTSSLALTGLGLTFPIITVITAFTNLFGSGGAPLCSIARGEGNEERAKKIMGNSFFMLVLTGAILTVVCEVFKKPVLYLFGASDDTYPYAAAYLTIYLIGTIFVMIWVGMNSFISAQGFGKTSMLTVLVGAAINIVLDPVFIFLFNMGVQGAALATVISQVYIGSLGAEVPDRQKGAVYVKSSCDETGLAADRTDYRPGSFRLHDVGHQRPDADCLQPDAGDIRRR